MQGENCLLVPISLHHPGLLTSLLPLCASNLSLTSRLAANSSFIFTPQTPNHPFHYFKDTKSLCFAAFFNVGGVLYRSSCGPSFEAS